MNPKITAALTCTASLEMRSEISALNMVFICSFSWILQLLQVSTLKQVGWEVIPIVAIQQLRGNRKKKLGLILIIPTVLFLLLCPLPCLRQFKNDALRYASQQFITLSYPLWSFPYSIIWVCFLFLCIIKINEWIFKVKQTLQLPQIVVCLHPFYFCHFHQRATFLWV